MAANTTRDAANDVHIAGRVPTIRVVPTVKVNALAVRLSPRGRGSVHVRPLRNGSVRVADFLRGRVEAALPVLVGALDLRRLVRRDPGADRSGDRHGASEQDDGKGNRHQEGGNSERRRTWWAG